MLKVIHQTSLKLIIFFSFSLAFFGCKTNSAAHLESYAKGTITLPDQTSIPVFIADTPLRQKMGLSDIKNEEFSENKGMLFPGNFPHERQFWMPNTFFDLDVFFLTEDFYVLDIQRSLKHYVGYTPKSAVPMSKKVICTHVLELKSSSPLAKKIKRGMLLKFKKN